MSEYADYKLDSEHEEFTRTIEDDMEDLQHEIEEAVNHYPNLSNYDVKKVLVDYLTSLKITNF